MSKKLHQKCTIPCFYALLRVFFKSHISHTSHPIISLCLTARNVACNFSAIFVKKMHEKRNHFRSSLLKMSLHQHSPFLISDSKIWFHRPKILVSSICSNHLFRPTFFRTMHDKSPSACVCGDDVAYLGGDVDSVCSAILGFANLPRYSQSAGNLLQALIHLLI